VQSFLKPGGLLFLFTSNASPQVVPTPQLEHVAAHLLLQQFGSRLDILRKIS
jgi:hypothetical protein